MTFVSTGESGTVTVPDGVLIEIATRAAESVPGLRVKRRRAVDLEAGVVRLSVAVHRSEPIIETAERAQEEVANALRAMCGIEAKVDVHVGELA
jgi:uncharacterized alkaline shock family protein YloU